MKCLFGRLLCLLMGGALPLPLAAVDYLVVFHQGATVSIYDAERLSCSARRRLARVQCRRSVFQTPRSQTNI